MSTSSLPGTTSSGAGVTAPVGPDASPLVVRSIDVDSPDFDSWLRTVALVFKDRLAMTPEGVDFRRPAFRGQRVTGAFDGDDLVATLRSWDTSLTVPGSCLDADAVSAVTVRPTHRRRGALRSLMTADLAAAVERGTAAAMLIASEAGIYARFGFGVSTEGATWTVDLRRAELVTQADDGGRVEMVPEADLRAIAPAIYDAARRPGALDRSSYWWDRTLGIASRPGDTHPPRTAVIHRDHRGVVDGYLRYRAEDRWEDRTCLTVVQLEELEAVGRQAYVGLWRFLLGLDLVATVRAEDRAVDEALPWLLRDPRAARMTSRSDFVWTRLLDPAAGLSARTYERAGTCTLEVRDPQGWASGRYRLDVDASGTGLCTRMRDEADVSLTVQALSSAWLGGGNLHAAAVAGQVVEHVHGSLDLLASMLRTSRSPWTATWF